MLITSGDLYVISLINPGVMPYKVGAPLVFTNINVIHYKSLSIKLNVIYQRHPLL